MILAILGGGASGMAAAIAASENPTCEIHLFERQNRVGRKLLSTGNGRCNLSNANVRPEAYHGADPDFVIPSLERYDVHNTLDFFRELGLYTIQESDSGRIYPWSDQASSVLDVLRFGLTRPNIHLHTSCEVTKVRKTPEGFRVESSEGSFLCHRLIVACGGLAGTALGGSMSGYQLLRSLGHSCSRLHPALVQLKSSYPRCPALKGIRAVCSLQITCDNRLMVSSQGEVQFTQYGLSGPAIFEVSRFVCQGSGEWNCHIDLLPELDADRILSMLKCRRLRCSALESSELLVGILHNRLGRLLIQEAGLAANIPMEQISDADLNRLTRICKDFTMRITEPMGMDSAQVTAGGILTADFDPITLESAICPGLYACGEVLDIDGDCGGYNLQWAWSSGRSAGAAAAGRIGP